MTMLIFILAVLFIHWVADFVCQSDWQAKNKSKDNAALLEHTLLYSILWFFPVAIGGYYLHYSPNMLWFIPITFIAHTITDYFTSRLNTYLWTKGEVHYFFVSVGFDYLCINDKHENKSMYKM